MTTKRNRSNLSLSAAEENAKAEALFNSIGDGAIATDEFGKITRINPVALRILGFRESEVLHRWFPKKIVATDDNDAPISLIDRPITQTFLSGKSVSRKLRYRTKSGTTVPVFVTTAPIMLGNRPIGAIEVFRDITVENEIDRMKSEFISLASHQLRTPLSAIKTYAHMLLDGFMGNLEPPQKKALQTVIAASNRMNELISTLLNITRIESGSISVAPKPTNTLKLVEEVRKELAHAAKAKDVSLTFKMSSQPQVVRTDSLILKEILVNMVSNAIKYTPENGTVNLKVTSRGKRLVITITDTGVGIPANVQDQIFTKFFRAPNVVRQETTGTGLGLYLVKGLVDQLGGKVWFKSVENVGTTFFLSLPKEGKVALRLKKQIHNAGAV
jgi:PAS domain S-box-containing protein